MNQIYPRLTPSSPFLIALAFMLAFTGISFPARSQDTITVMQYNLLYYGAYTDFCTYQNNSIGAKDTNLKIIVDHVQPDILGVNEIGAGEAITQRVLNNVLNVDEPDRYARASFTNRSGSNITNMLYYDQQKFELYDQKAIINIVRDINLYTLIYKDESLAQGGDTTFLNCIVVHLKAGSSSSDQQARASETQAVMSFLESNNVRGNVLFMGDLNINSSYETSYEQLTTDATEGYRFYDPVDQPGTWYNNPQMALYHTQSPRTTYHSCFVSGGLDDRYDFILASSSLMNGQLGLKYLEDSYNTLGQDGQRYNLNLLDPVNESAPAGVIQALYDMSDHLPVSLSLVTTDFANNLPGVALQTPEVHFRNPAKDVLNLSVSGVGGALEIRLLDLTGTPKGNYQAHPVNGVATMELDLSGLAPGMYLIQVVAPGMKPYSGKLIKL